MERVTFRDVAAVREIADREFSRIGAAIKSLLPDACIEHVGGTALPHGITKGDLDIQVRVGADAFEAASAALAGAFAPDPENAWGDGAASFRFDDADIPTGIHLTEIGGGVRFPVEVPGNPDQPPRISLPNMTASSAVSMGNPWSTTEA